MLSRIIHFSIKNKLIIAVFTIALIIWGVWSATKLPVDALPDVTNNQVQFTLTGHPNTLYVIQSSTDLTAWTPILTNSTSLAGILKFVDSGVSGYSQRYYRAVRVLE